VHEKVPLFLVPDEGAIEPHVCVCELLGAVTSHDAKFTPDLASVSVMLQVTFCADDDTSTEVGDRLNPVSAGATVSGSEVTVSVDGKPEVAGFRLARFPTASEAITLAVQVPDTEYLGNVIPHDQVPLCGVPDEGADALQLCW
jgi:hypothetical protein